MAERQQVDLDHLVNYKAEYTAIIKHYKISGDNLTGLCPFHDDNSNSFSADLKTGLWKCHAENATGNFITFWAQLNGIGTKEAYKQILAKYGVAQEPKTKQNNKQELQSYTLKEYAFAKRLPEDFLAERCRAFTNKGRDGLTWLQMPYFDVEGNEVTNRKRYGDKEFRWKRGGQVCLYGEWRIPEFEAPGYVVLCEGESDTQSLWYMGIPALGVPGASMFKATDAPKLQGFKLYIHKEPDQGGETFVQKVSRGLREGGFAGEAYVWQCHPMGAKDPSDLYIEHGQQEASGLIKQALRTARPLDYQTEEVPEAISGAPLQLRQPEGWIYSEKGISAIDEKTFQPVVYCRTPLIITKRLSNLGTGEEKVEVAFKRDGQWHSAVFPRSTVFQSRSIIALADRGCTITSENAKYVVRFLGALEEENIDIIPKIESTSVLGWQPGNRFLPGNGGDIELDLDSTRRGIASAYCKSGTLDGWVASMTPHRSRDRFRFILAASFAAPLLRITRQRVFGIYNWGDSAGGKTAGLKAALSAWGDPNRLMTTFNSTQVALELKAALYNDLPMGVDERQLAGGNQDSLEKIVYMLASGEGRGRGSKTGELRDTHTWRNITLMTGEEPLVRDNTQTGVNNRILEIYGGPFDNEAEAAAMHQQAAEDCGWAGPEFVGRIIALGDPVVDTAYTRMYEYVKSLGYANGSHVAGIAVVALADAMIDSWFFSPEDKGEAVPHEDVALLAQLGVKPESWNAAKRMAKAIVAIRAEDAREVTSVNQNAEQTLCDWILENAAYFGEDGHNGIRYGEWDEDGETVYILQTRFKQVLNQFGFSPRKTMKYLYEQGLIGARKGRGRGDTNEYAVVRKFNGKSTRMVAFRIGTATNESAKSKPTEWLPMQSTLDPFAPGEDIGEDLPF